jgi:hypothetical protein
MKARVQPRLHKTQKPADLAIFVLTSGLTWMDYGAEIGVDKRWV